MLKLFAVRQVVALAALFFILTHGRAVPWKLSILEAQAQAAKEKKPIFMLVHSGHPLGCV